MEILYLANNLAGEIKNHPDWILITFFISGVISGLPVIGSILPVSVFQLALGSAAARLVLSPFSVLMFLIPGLIAGDSIGFFAGHHFNISIKHWKFFHKRQALLQKCEQSVERYGGIAIILGRIAGPLRTITPITSGILGMSSMRFLFFDLLAALLWCLTHLGGGYLMVNHQLWHKIHGWL